MNKIKNKNKKGLAVLLALVLVLSTVPVPSFALPAGVTISDSGDDPFTIAPTALTDGKIWTDKSVEDLTNGLFKVTLRAAGQDYQVAQPSIKFDIILALDYSISMNTNSKLTNMKNAAKAIALQLIGPSNNKTGNRVGIVRYSSAADYDLEFTDVIGDVNTTIDSAYTQGYTDIQNAFLVSQGAINTRTNTTRKPIVILISDGEPTVYHDSFTDHSINSQRHQDANSGSNYVWYTVQQGMLLKKGVSSSDSSDDVGVYTIGFDLVGNAIATATLQPTASNTSDYRNGATFNHTYWAGSYIISGSYTALYDALNAISLNFTSSKPTAFVGSNYTDLVITDDLGNNFEVDGALPTGVTLNSGVVTWTIDGDTFATLPYGSTSLSAGQITTVTFNLKLKETPNPIVGTHYTNDSAKAEFQVDVANPAYSPGDGLNILMPLLNKGYVTTIAPDVQGRIDITKVVQGPVTGINRTFNFTIYDAASGGNVIGSKSITVNGAASKMESVSFSIPYNGFNGNNQATYYVQENDGPAPAFWTYDNSARKAVTLSRTVPTGSVSFTNSYAPKGSLTVKKAWTGNGPHSQITFDLYKEVSPGNWSPVSQGWVIPANDVNGTPIDGLELGVNYKVVENFLQDYTASYSPLSVTFSAADIAAGVQGALSKTITITNDYTKPNGKITVNKIWSDSNDQAGDRPSSLLYNITGPNNYVGTLTLSAPTWSNFFDTETFGTYTFTEVIPQDYQATLNPQSQSIAINPVDARLASLTFTNTYIEPKGSLTVEKVWKSENNDYAAYRPATITIDLYKDGVISAHSVTLPEADATPWVHTFPNLPFGTYSVVEHTVPDYTISYSADVKLEKSGITNGILAREGRIVVTNTFNNPKGSIEISKTWVESGVEAAVVRPIDLKVFLYKNGILHDSVLLSTANTIATHTFSNLPLDGSLYTVMESSTEGAKLSSYAEAISYGGDNASSAGVILSPTARGGSASLINTYAKGTVTVVKNWVDGDNPVNERPNAATIHLFKTYTPETIPATYSDVTEESPEAIELSSALEFDPVRVLVATKVITRPETTVIFYDLEVGDGITYDVTEDSVPFYTTTFEGQMFVLNDNLPNQLVKVKNDYTNPKGSLTVNKSWVYGNDPVRPTSITVHLYENGSFKESMTFVGSHTFTGLDLGKNYTILEADINNYAISYEGFEAYMPVKGSVSVASGTATIKNTYIPEVGDLEVVKVWAIKTGGPIEVTVRRYVNGVLDEAFVRTATLSASVNEADNWKASFNNIEIYGPGGVKYDYMAQENGADLALYDASNSGSVQLNDETVMTITFTNTYAPDKGELVIKKVWLNSDNEPMDPEYPAVEVKLVVDGVPDEGIMTLNAANDWMFVRSGLNVEKTYSVIEISKFEEFEVSYSATNIDFNKDRLYAEWIVTNKRTVDDPKIEVTKTVSPDTVQLLGGTATFNYTIEFKNTGNRTLYDLTFEDIMTGPAGATMTYHPVPNDSGDMGMVYYLDTSLAPGAVKTFNYSVTVNRVGVYDNDVVGYGYYIESKISDNAEESATATEQPTEPTEPSTTQPTTETPTVPPTTEIITEETPLGGVVNFDEILPPVEQEELVEEEVPLAEALPQTGQLPSDLFYVIGGLLSGVGVFMKRKNR